MKVWAGDIRPIGPQWCTWNRCLALDQYAVALSDTNRWLKVLDPTSGQLVDLPPNFFSGPADSFDHVCFGVPDSGGGPMSTEGAPLIDDIFVQVPIDALPGEVSDVSVQVSSLINPRQPLQGCQTALLVVGPRDCNMNSQDDAIDIATGVSKDEDLDGTPDECDEHFDGPEVSIEIDPVNVFWESLGDVVYDAVEGDLDLLRESGGDFRVATEGCAAEDLVGTLFPHNNELQPGEGAWFLVRYVLTAGNGSYVSSGENELPGRDAGIAASGLDCR
jgi:hypothetical protein